MHFGWSDVWNCAVACTWPGRFRGQVPFHKLTTPRPAYDQGQGIYACCLNKIGSNLYVLSENVYISGLIWGLDMTRRSARMLMVCKNADRGRKCRTQLAMPKHVTCLTKTVLNHAYTPWACFLSVWVSHKCKLHPRSPCQGTEHQNPMSPGHCSPGWSIPDILAPLKGKTDGQDRCQGRRQSSTGQIDAWRVPTADFEHASNPIFWAKFQAKKNLVLIEFKWRWGQSNDTVR